MKSSRFTPKQFVRILREHDHGIGAEEMACKHGKSKAALYS